MFDKKFLIGDENSQKEIKNTERAFCILLLVIIALLVYNNSKLQDEIVNYEQDNINNININKN